jgi:hypothetical protein
LEIEFGNSVLKGRFGKLLTLFGTWYRTRRIFFCIGKKGVPYRRLDAFFAPEFASA